MQVIEINGSVEPSQQFRETVVAKAREYIGTPYGHSGRKKQESLDCLGLLICVGKELGIIPNHFDIKGYSPNPDGISLLSETKKYLPYVVGKDDLQIGDIVVFSIGGRPTHYGIVSDYHSNRLAVIHASNARGHNKVVEHRLIFSSNLKFVSGFKFIFKE